jgi:hypothetical protein
LIFYFYAAGFCGREFAERKIALASSLLLEPKYFSGSHALAWEPSLDAPASRLLTGGTRFVEWDCLKSMTYWEQAKSFKNNLLPVQNNL